MTMLMKETGQNQNQLLKLLELQDYLHYKTFSNLVERSTQDSGQGLVGLKEAELCQSCHVVKGFKH